MKDKKERVVAVLISYGNRWKFLEQAIQSILNDENVKRLIIVDNGIDSQDAFMEKITPYGNRVMVLKQEKNIGSAGGFAAGIAEAQKEDAEFVYLSDDDMVPERGFVQKYLDVYDILKNEKVVICGHRVDVPGNSEIYYRSTIVSLKPLRTFFSVFSIKKLNNFFATILQTKKDGIKKGAFVPIVPIQGFVYGGAFVPMDAIRNAPLPDASLFMYGDDVAYSWGVESLGYVTYAAASVIINDVDLSFGTGSHIDGLFRKDTASFKVYYRIRNMIRISRQYSKQNGLVLMLSVIGWIAGLFFIGLIRQGFTKNYFVRVLLIFDAVRAGYDMERPVPAGMPQ